MANDFVIETQKHCFLCLGETVGHEYPDPERKSTSNHSIQYLSKMLKLDMKKVFHDNEAIPEHLLEKVAKSRLMVELCEDCASWNNSFSKKCQQLEKIKMDVLSKLGHLQERLLSGVVGAVVTDELTDTDSASGAILKEKLGIVKILRKDLVHKCKVIVSSIHPRIKVQKLSPQDIPIRAVSPTPEPVEIENENDDIDYLEDYGSADSPMATQLDSEMQTNSTSSASKGVVHLRILTPMGRHKCKVCSKEFAHYTSFVRHCKTTHLRSANFKCKLCGLIFKRKDGLYTHHRGIHEKKRFKCRHCPQSFSYPSVRTRHIKNGSCYSKFATSKKATIIRSSIKAVRSPDFVSVEDMNKKYDDSSPHMSTVQEDPQEVNTQIQIDTQTDQYSIGDIKFETMI